MIESMTRFDSQNPPPYLFCRGCNAHQETSIGFYVRDTGEYFCSECVHNISATPRKVSNAAIARITGAIEHDRRARDLSMRCARTLRGDSAPPAQVRAAVKLARYYSRCLVYRARFLKGVC